MNKENIEERLFTINKEIEHFTLPSEKERCYLLIRIGIYLELFDLYQSKYFDLNPELTTLFYSLMSLYRTLRIEVYQEEENSKK